MTKIPNSWPKYDLEERTFQFARVVSYLLKIRRSQNIRFCYVVRMFRSLKFGICDLFVIWDLILGA